MEYNCMVSLKRNNKTIVFFLKDGEGLSLENIVDVEVCSEDGTSFPPLTSSLTLSQRRQFIKDLK